MNWKYLAVGLLGLGFLASVGRAGAQSSATLKPTEVDHLVRAEWQKAGVIPAVPADDARYLRRVYLDITGMIPPPEVVTEFLADRSPDRRAKAVERLLDSPGYAANWTNYWDRTLMFGRVENARMVDKGAFRLWLNQQFDKNTPWNKFVYDLVSASGQNSAGGARKTQPGLTAAGTTDADGHTINGATNWVLRFTGKPEDLSGTASKIFLGVQIQCAQCHDHKTEKWKQTDFRAFTACFVNTRPKPVNPDGYKDKMARDYRMELTDVNRPFVPRGKKAGDAALYAASKPAALDGSDFSEAANRRQALAAWMTAKENPWFAEAFVNRMWAHFLGRGFVEPIDDFRPSNPTVMPDLMARLSDDFVASGYDVKHLIRIICATQIYQLSSGPAPKTDPDNTLWARFRLKPMGPAQLVDSLVQATNTKPVLEKLGGGDLEQIKANVERQFSFLFDVDEEFEQKDFEGTIPQALLMLNGGIVNTSVTPIPGTALADILTMPGTDAQKIDALYMRTLSRMPTAAELTQWTQYVNAPREIIAAESAPQPTGGRRQAMRPNANAGKGGKRGQANAGFNPLARGSGRIDPAFKTAKGQAYEDMFWALLNSSEFLFNH
jgi:hypothetical protein